MAAQQPVQHHTHNYDSKLQFAIQLSKGVHNRRGLESPVYAIWDIALNDLVNATQNCSVHPQLMLTHEQNLEQGISREYSRIPDFAVLLKQGNDIQRTYLILVENKPLPVQDQSDLIQWMESRSQTAPIITQIRNQAKFVFKRSLQTKIVSILTYGEHWLYTFFERETTSEFSIVPSASMDPGNILWSEIYTLGTPGSDAKLVQLRNDFAQPFNLNPL